LANGLWLGAKIADEETKFSSVFCVAKAAMIADKKATYSFNFLFSLNIWESSINWFLKLMTRLLRA
jgi:hypothetical protein